MPTHHTPGLLAAKPLVKLDFLLVQAITCTGLILR